MPSNEDPFSEAIQLKKAKKRLLGALIILIALLILSYFFLEDRSLTHNQNIKISFIDESDSSINNSIDQSSENFDVDSFFIQVGIFSDKQKTLNLLSSIQSFGIGCTLETVDLNGKKMFRVKTEIFESYTEAESALEILKSNKFSGIIKKNNS